MRVAFAGTALPAKGALVLFASDGGSLSATAKSVDDRTGGALSRAIASSRFKGSKGQTHHDIGAAQHGASAA